MLSAREEHKNRNCEFRYHSIPAVCQYSRKIMYHPVPDDHFQLDLSWLVHVSDKNARQDHIQRINMPKDN